eukprot:8695331-Pyramimonas_sp.AAC.1
MLFVGDHLGPHSGTRRHAVKARPRAIVTVCARSWSTFRVRSSAQTSTFGRERNMDASTT